MQLKPLINSSQFSSYQYTYLPTTDIPIYQLPIPYLLLIRMTPEPGHGLFDRFTHRRGFHAKCFFEFERIYNEWLVELIHHFHGFPGFGNEEATDPHHELAHTAHL